MSKVTVNFIKCAMIYFALAMILGITMTIDGPNYPLRPIHTHFNLLGWISMMIFGVAYHILPRFSGAPLWSDKLSVAHLWLANIGLIGMAIGWWVLSQGMSNATLHVFSLVTGISVLMFLVNMFKTIQVGPAFQPKPK